MDIVKKIRIIEDFPIKGISFKDITTLLADPEVFTYAIDKVAESLKNVEFDAIVAPEARGFIVAAPLSVKLAKPFVPIRKKGKLPYKTVTKTFQLEYGTDSLQMHADALSERMKVVIVDDLLATGGTVKAIREMIEEIGAEVVGARFIIELDSLGGRDKLPGLHIESLVHYDK